MKFARSPIDRAQHLAKISYCCALFPVVSDVDQKIEVIHSTGFILRMAGYTPKRWLVAWLSGNTKASVHQTGVNEVVLIKIPTLAKTKVEVEFAYVSEMLAGLCSS